jgi:lysophospholipase L1-like esterase
MTTAPRLEADDTANRAVLIGASYAEGWQTPELPGLAVINMGRSGEGTAQMLARFDADVTAAQPDTVIIWGHINDIFRAPNGDMAAAALNATKNLEAMIDKARAAGIRVIVATELTLSEPRGFMHWVAAAIGRLRGKVGYQERISAHVRQVNEFLRDHAMHNGLLLLDLEHALNDGWGRRRSEFTREDGSHVNAAGYAALTAFAAAQLRDQL